MKKTPILITVSLILGFTAGSLTQYAIFSRDAKGAVYPNVIEFQNGNSRDTYFTIHNINEAHETSKGEGVKVGIIDWNFGYEEHGELYSGVVQLTDYPGNLANGHGYWMAAVLKEVAPECEIYALAVGVDQSGGYDEGKTSDAVITAIEWAVENNMDVLSLSLAAFKGENKIKLDGAIDYAAENGIVTTFIHNDNPNNILPFALAEYDDNFYKYGRLPDINVFQYDYNALQLTMHMKYLSEGPARTYGDITNGMYIPFFSNSSMSPVTAGFIALLKGVNNTLTPAEYKDILIKTSYSTRFDGGYADFEAADVDRVVDMQKAVDYISENY